MAKNTPLKQTLKWLKEHEATVSMVLGAVVVVFAAGVIINTLSRPKITSESSTSETQSNEEIINALPTVPSEKTETGTEAKPSALKQVGLSILKLFGSKNEAEVTETPETPTPIAFSPADVKLARQDNGTLISINKPTAHTVVAGDSLWKIAQTYYGSGYNWVDLATANKLAVYSSLEIGQQLTLPDVAVRVPRYEKLLGQVVSQNVAGALDTGNTGTYTVQKGDSLWTIAQNAYGDGFRWTEIYEANRNLVKSPGMIEPGWTLTLPPKD